MLSLLMFKCILDRVDPIVISKQFVIGHGCKEPNRNIILTLKEESSSDEIEYKGEIILGTEEYSYSLGNETPNVYKFENNYMHVSSIMHDLVWVRLQVICPNTGKLVFDSGKQKSEEIVCYQEEGRIFFLNGCRSCELTTCKLK